VNAAFAVSCSVTDAWGLLCDAEDGSDEATLWILADDKRSWGAAEYVPGQTEYEVAQYGPRALWDEIEDAYRAWQAAGEPSRDRYGLTIDKDGQHVWLGGPGAVIG
jgi:hypothetical protein